MWAVHEVLIKRVICGWLRAGCSAACPQGHIPSPTFFPWDGDSIRGFIKIHYCPLPGLKSLNMSLLDDQQSGMEMPKDKFVVRLVWILLCTVFLGPNDFNSGLRFPHLHTKVVEAALQDAVMVPLFLLCWELNLRLMTYEASALPLSYFSSLLVTFK